MLASETHTAHVTECRIFEKLFSNLTTHIIVESWVSSDLHQCNRCLQGGVTDCSKVVFLFENLDRIFP